jgi:nucleoside-diphosphate-sugar epimerase
MIPTKRLARPRLLIIGCGDVGTRCLARLKDRYRVFALTSSPSRCAALRADGAIPIVGDLDRPATLRRLAGLASAVLHLAPPANHDSGDARTRRLLTTLTRPHGFAHLKHRPTIVPERGRTPRAINLAPASRAVTRLVYASTSGVYGNCDGALIDETRTPNPENPRAARRVAAETAIRAQGARVGNRTVTAAIAATIVRIPGIYAAERLPLARLVKGTPALLPDQDVFTSHIHADDLAALMVRALRRGLPQRILHAVDDTHMKMADYFDRVAEASGLPKPPRIGRAEAEQVLSPMLLSFMRESRQLDNRRMKRELRYRLRYPTVDDFLREWCEAGRPGR